MRLPEILDISGKLKVKSRKLKIVDGQNKSGIITLVSRYKILQKCTRKTKTYPKFYQKSYRKTKMYQYMLKMSKIDDYFQEF